jgi:hypothetical protein
MFIYGYINIALFEKTVLKHSRIYLSIMAWKRYVIQWNSVLKANIIYPCNTDNGAAYKKNIYI